ncbi:MAG: hypothetical protein J5780_05610, partial [Treponema sp.]|nr:hypothetical protein [Treponema sp.]
MEKEQYTNDFINANQAFILSQTKNTVTVAVTEETPDSAKENIKLLHNKKVVFKILSREGFESKIAMILCAAGKKENET